jgi:hypothetical protein
VLSYRRDTYAKETWVTATSPAEIDEAGLTFDVRVDPHGEWSTELDVVAILFPALMKNGSPRGS